MYGFNRTVHRKEPYPQLDIDRLIDGSSGYPILSFMDSYLRYNYILRDPFDALKTNLLLQRHALRA